MKDQTYYNQIIKELIQQSRHHLKSFSYPDEAIPDEYVTPDQVAGVPAPPLEKAIPEDATLIDLPSIEETQLGTMSLVETFRKRHSHRQYSSDPLSLDELAYLCWSFAGVKEVHPKKIWTKRTAPSGGARHPFETYLVVQRVTGLEPGIYRYSGLEHKLVLVKLGADYTAQLAETMQKFVADAAVTVIWTVVPYRNEWRYMFYSAREVAMDIGHYCENLYLAAESIHAGTCGIAAYDQTFVDDLLEVDGEEEFAIYIAPVGKAID
ncbi:SagB/ThcOx family dehydrogenase [bacterium]|nr:SagB/ThcOx family dehydrogenase [bacterium]